MSTLKVSSVQHASAASPAITLDANGQATLNGLAYPTSGSLSGRNRIINGDMRIDQRNAGAAVTTSSLQTPVYTVDRWYYYNDVVSKRTIQRTTVAPPGYTNSLLITVISTDISGPQQFVGQAIEGFNTADLAWGTASAIPATLSFWVRSSVTGQHGGTIQNDTNSRSFPFAYTISSANTWEYKTISILPETSGSWNTSNGVGVSVRFENGVGYQKATAGSWVSSNATSSTGSVNLCATNGATWYITGVQLEAGTVATPFERRSYGQELALCQRYFQPLTINTYSYCGYTFSSSDARAAIPLICPMRIAPTGITVTGTVFFSTSAGNGSGSVVFSAASDSILSVASSGATGLAAAGGTSALRGSATGTIQVSAEL